MAIRLPKFDPIDFLLSRKFPSARLQWHDGGMFSVPPLSEGKAAVEEYRGYLQGLSEERIAALVAEERAKQIEENRLQQELEEKRRFFSELSATANFERWSRASYWTIDEAVALALGKEPTVVDLKRIKAVGRESAFARRYMDFHDLALRAVWAGQLWDRSLPTIFLAWARRMQLPVVPELTTAVEALGLQIADWKSLHDDLKKLHDDLKERHDALTVRYGDFITKSEEEFIKLHDTNKEFRRLNDREIAQLKESLASVQSRSGAISDEPEEKALRTRERESLLRLIVGMAIGGYGYDPTAARSTVTGEIASDLEKAGVPLDPDTVRKWLKEAASLLPRETD